MEERTTNSKMRKPLVKLKLSDVFHSEHSIILATCNASSPTVTSFIETCKSDLFAPHAQRMRELTFVVSQNNFEVVTFILSDTNK